MSLAPAPLDPVQMLWVRGDLSRMELLSVRSFLAQGHPVHLYTYDAPGNVPAGVSVFDASAIVPASLAPAAATSPFARGSYASFSDYFRYHLLLARGGWWADMDVVALKPWRDFAPVVVACTEEHGHGRTANCYVLRLPAGHAIAAACCEALAGKSPADFAFGETGPLLLHRILGPEGVSVHCPPPETFGPVPWAASDQLVRPLWRRFTLGELKQRIRRPHLSCRFTSRTVAIHLWHETWREAGRDKHARFPFSCLYERLQRRYNP